MLQEDLLTLRFEGKRGNEMGCLWLSDPLSTLRFLFAAPEWRPKESQTPFSCFHTWTLTKSWSQGPSEIQSNFHLN